jgi:predicted phosphodiesterase
MWLRRVRLVVLALAGAAVAVALAGQTRASVGPFDATLSVRGSLSGETTVLLAPLGEIHFDTHDAPVGLVLRVDQLRLDEAQRFAANPALLELVGGNLAGDMRNAVEALVRRVLLAALVGGLVGALVARARWRGIVAGAALGGLAAGGVAGAAVATYEPRAIAEPHYRGLLTIAPTAVGNVQAIVDNFDRYRIQLAELVGNVAVLYQAGERLPDLETGTDTIRVLHVSDVHLNPQAFDLMRQLIEQFGVEAILDSGDTTDWGSEPETQLLGEIESLGIPYVWVRGNHDSTSTQAAVAAQPNAIVLDGDLAEVAGLRIWGIGDPRYTPDKDQPTGGDVEQEAALAFAPEVARRLSRSTSGVPSSVDVVLVHDQRVARELAGRVELVLAGHTHHARERRMGPSTRLLVEGSSGGGGLRGLQGTEPTPLSASVLYFDRATGDLVAYDRVAVRGLGGAGVTIERHLARPLAEPGASTTTTTSSTTTTTTRRP